MAPATQSQVPAKKIKSELPAILLVVTMFAFAEHTGQKEVIFPEIEALALGASGNEPFLKAMHVTY